LVSRIERGSRFKFKKTVSKHINNVKYINKIKKKEVKNLITDIFFFKKISKQKEERGSLVKADKKTH